jgi:hypothetical protein
MSSIVVWIILWFFVWGILNIYFRWKWEKYQSKKYVPRGLFFLISFLITYYLFNSIVSVYIDRLLIGLLITNLVGLSLSFNKSYYRNFIKDRFLYFFKLLIFYINKFQF